MPGNSSYKKLNGGKVSDRNKPAIQMDYEDHKLTASYGSSVYVTAQKAMITLPGGYKLAMELDIANINDLFPDGKYDDAIKKMKAWAKCMGYV